MLPLPPAMEELEDSESDDDVLRRHVVDGELRLPAWGVIYKSKEEAEAHMEAWGGGTGPPTAVCCRDQVRLHPLPLRRDSSHALIPSNLNH